MPITVKRVYEPVEEGDGYRVLVDRVWPRGLARERIRIDAWLKEAAPSDALRRWFGHDPNKWERFKERYHEELAARPDALERLLAAARTGPVTLVFAARDAKHNNAVALKEYLERRLAGPPRMRRRAG